MKRQGSTARSVYVSLLRRAFLLRVHPDRFRNHEDFVRHQQATLVKALSQRMSQSDFLTWQSSLGSSSNSQSSLPKTSGIAYPYVLEKRDGTLLSTKLNLSGSVDEILSEISFALTTCGAATPTVPSHHVDSKQQHSTKEDSEHSNGRKQNIHYASSNSNTKQGQKIDRQYDLVSNRGRNLKMFLMDTTTRSQDPESYNHNDNSILTDMIQERRYNRMDAQAAALTVRKTFQFQSVDALRTGWSSSSVAILLRRLLSLHTEHSKEFNVESFYPLRLVFTPTDFMDEQGVTYPENDQESIPVTDINNSNLLDVYGGELRLHPAWTSSQWLKVLRLVTPEQLKNVKRYRTLAEERSKLVQDVLGIRIRKGYSCSSWEYHSFLERLSFSVSSKNSTSEHDKSNMTGDELSNYYSNIVVQAESSVVATVESSHSVRRATVTNEGIIRFGSKMDTSDCRAALEKLLPKAKEFSAKHENDRISCNRTVHLVQRHLGLQKVYRASPLVSQVQFDESLKRILSLVEVKAHDYFGDEKENTSVSEEHEFVKRNLSGNSLGIACDGNFCHLGDDGSFVIPHNWEYSS